MVSLSAVNSSSLRGRLSFCDPPSCSLCQRAPGSQGKALPHPAGKINIRERMGTLPRAFGRTQRPNLYEVDTSILIVLDSTHLCPLGGRQNFGVSCCNSLLLHCCFVSKHERDSYFFSWPKRTVSKLPYLSCILFCTFKFWPSCKNTRISEAVIRRRSVDHSPGPVRLPDYKCRFPGPLRARFSPRWPEVVYIIIDEKPGFMIYFPRLRASNATEDTQHPSNVSLL